MTWKIHLGPNKVNRAITSDICCLALRIGMEMEDLSKRSKDVHAKNTTEREESSLISKNLMEKEANAEMKKSQLKRQIKKKIVIKFYPFFRSRNQASN